MTNLNQLKQKAEFADFVEYVIMQSIVDRVMPVVLREKKAFNKGYKTKYGIDVSAVCGYEAGLSSCEEKLAEQKEEIMEYARDTIPVAYKEKLFRRFNYK